MNSRNEYLLKHNPRLLFLEQMRLYVVIGLFQWLMFLLIDRSIVTNDISFVFLCMFWAVILVVSIVKLRGVLDYSAKRFSWITIFVFLMYISQFLAIISSIDWSVSARSPHSFVLGAAATSLTKIQALYFALATISTTGYGDIHPSSDGTRLLVGGQLVLGSLVTVFFVAIFVSLYTEHIRREK